MEPWQEDLVRVLECQAEVYEYLVGSREEAPIEEYQERINRINLEYNRVKSEMKTVDIPVFNPLPGQLLIERINELKNS